MTSNWVKRVQLLLSPSVGFEFPALAVYSTQVLLFPRVTETTDALYRPPLAHFASTGGPDASTS